MCNIDSDGIITDRFPAEEEIIFMEQRNQNDRRMVHDLNYFENGGRERRSWKERRQGAVAPRKLWRWLNNFKAAPRK